MGFLWSEIGFEFSTISFRYYSEMIWYMYSVAGFLPLLLLTIYKVHFQPIPVFHQPSGFADASQGSEADQTQVG
jgi:hypothetical protein